MAFGECDVQENFLLTDGFFALKVWPVLLEPRFHCFSFADIAVWMRVDPLDPGPLVDPERLVILNTLI